MSPQAHIDIKAKHMIVCRVSWRGVGTRLSNQDWNYVLFWLELELCEIVVCHNVLPVQIVSKLP